MKKKLSQNSPEAPEVRGRLAGGASLRGASQAIRLAPAGAEEATRVVPPTLRERLVVFTLASALALPAAFAQSGQQSEAYQASMAQGDVKRDAEAIQAELIALRDQMRQLMPNDVAAVDNAIAKLQSLSAEEMTGAISQLQEASRSKDAKQQVDRIAGALKTQGVVSSGLKKLSVDLQARETIQSLSEELTDLVRREVSSSFELARLGKIQQAPKDLRNRDGERYQVANEDQKGVTADIKLLGRKLENLAKEFESDPHNGLVQAAAVSIADRLPDLADQAANLSASGPLDQAVAAQTKVIRTLVSMQQALATGGDPIERLQALATRLQRGADAQKEVMDAVMLIGERQDLDRNFKLMQASLGDDVGAVRFELEPLSGSATGQLAAAGDYVEKALLNYKRMWEEHMDARGNTQEAHKGMLAALQALKDQIARMEANRPQTPQQLAQQLEQLQRDVAMAAMQQNQLANQPVPNPAQQKTMQDAVNNFQQRALEIAPEAAKTLGEAASQLNNPAPEAQKEAAQKLAEAARELAQQKQEAAQLAAAEQQLEKAEELAEKAQEKLEKNDTAGAANDLAAAQQQAEAAQKNAEQAAPEAAQQAAQANQELGQAAQKSAQKDGQSAQDKAQAAQEAIAQAQQNLAQAMAQTPGMKHMAKDMGAGDQVTQNDPNQKGQAPQSQANGNGGPSGDNLKGAGDKGGPVEVLDGLTPEERAAVAQLQEEKPPREFAPEVQQYFKNIADGAGL